MGSATGSRGRMAGAARLEPRGEAAPPGEASPRRGESADLVDEQLSGCLLRPRRGTMGNQEVAYAEPRPHREEDRPPGPAGPGLARAHGRRRVRDLVPGQARRRLRGGTAG